MGVEPETSSRGKINLTPVSTSATLLRLFVYGTLKRGGSYHDRFCRGVLTIEDASVVGTLHTLPPGYPMLVVAKTSILAEGTADALADAATQQRLEAASAVEAIPILRPPDGGGERIAGEILTFDDPVKRLPLLDELEAFHPGALSLYRRVLLAVQPERTGRPVPAWTYVADRWPPVCFTGSRR